MLSFGKAPPASDYPALFAIGTTETLKAIWRSDDAGKSWLRVNDDQHQWGTRFRCIAGDPRSLRPRLRRDRRPRHPVRRARGVGRQRRGGAQPAGATATSERSDHVKVCQVGYLPNETKFAMLTAKPTGRRRRPPQQRRLARAHHDARRRGEGCGLRRHASTPSTSRSSPSRARTTSTCPASARATISASATTCSPAPFRLAMRSYTGQRCGTAVNLAPDFPQYRYDAVSHREAHVPRLQRQVRHARCAGGWHDAGDYGRYIVNSGITTGTLLWAYELNEAKLARSSTSTSPSPADADPRRARRDQVEPRLDAADAGSRGRRRLAQGDDRESSAGLVMPAGRHGAPVLIVGSGHAPYKTTQATADLAAVAAIAARVYRPFDAALRRPLPRRGRARVRRGRRRIRTRISQQQPAGHRNRRLRRQGRGRRTALGGGGTVPHHRQSDLQRRTSSRTTRTGTRRSAATRRTAGRTCRTWRCTRTR